MRKIVLASIVGVMSLIGATGNVGLSSDLTGTTLVGQDIPISMNEKYVSAFVGDLTTTVSRTDKWYTDDESVNWTIWTFEVCKGEDDAWFVMEFGK